MTLPVADVDRAKQFYQSLGWRLDNDRTVDDNFRTVQFTPPQSQSSIQFGIGLTTAEPGSVGRLMLAVDDINSARSDLVNRGVDVTDVYHYERSPGRSGEIEARVPGPDPNGRSYFTYASFADPDGNGWLLQQITTRLPGREWPIDTDVTSSADLLQETAQCHDAFEKVAPPHGWRDWYAAYMHERGNGSTPDEAALAAYRYMAEVKHLVVPPAGDQTGAAER